MIASSVDKSIRQPNVDESKQMDELQQIPQAPCHTWGPSVLTCNPRPASPHAAIRSARPDSVMLNCAALLCLVASGWHACRAAEGGANAAPMQRSGLRQSEALLRCPWLCSCRCFAGKLATAADCCMEVCRIASGLSTPGVLAKARRGWATFLLSCQPVARST